MSRRILEIMLASFFVTTLNIILGQVPDNAKPMSRRCEGIGLGQPRPESAYFLFKLEVKLKENWCGAAQARICLISIEIVIKYKRKLPWGSPGQNLLDFYLNFNQK